MIAEEMKGEGIRIQMEPPEEKMDMQVKDRMLQAVSLSFTCIPIFPLDSTWIRISFIHFSLATNT